jgi:hypothetical protein
MTDLQEQHGCYDTHDYPYNHWKDLNITRLSYEEWRPPFYL